MQCGKCEGKNDMKLGDFFLEIEACYSIKKSGGGEWIRREMAMLPEKYHCGRKYRWNVMYKISALDLKKYTEIH